MRALTVRPGSPGSARLDDVAEPLPGDGQMLVAGLAVGVCGTDREIVAGQYGCAPPERDRLIIGHESVGRVVDCPSRSAFSPGDLVVGIVRRPDPVPCPACSVGQWDMCRNGRYTEHGINSLDGFAAERYLLTVDGAVPVPPELGALAVLVEPASVVAKAWEHIERIGGRAAWFPKRALVTGAGPIGLLAALLGVQRGYEVRVVDIVTEGPKPSLVKDLGASYHSGAVSDACHDVDIVVECTGVGQVVMDVIRGTAPAGVVCLAGMSSGTHRVTLDAAAVNRDLVLQNDVVFGTVNANRSHYEAAVDALRRADPNWLERMISRREALANWRDALEHREDDVKVVIDLDVSGLPHHVLS